MGLMESLSLGLRGAGGVLSPGAFQAGVQEDLQVAQQRRQEALMKLQEEMAAVKERALGESVSPFLAKGDFEGAAAAAANSGAPGGTRLALELSNKAEERKARAMQLWEATQVRRDALQQQERLALSRAEDQRQQNAILNSFKERHLALEEQMKPLMAFMGQQGLDIKKMQADAAKDREIGRGTAQLGAALEKSGLPESDAVLGAVEKALEQNPNIAEYISGPKSLLPDMVIGTEIATAKQAFQKLFNITLKNRSGSAVTNQELDRLKKEFAAGAFKTPAQLQAAVEQARNIINKHYASIASGYGPDVLKAYNENIRQFGGRVVLEAPSGGGGGSQDDPLGLR